MIEAPAKHIHMISEPVQAPELPEEEENTSDVPEEMKEEEKTTEK